MLAEVAFSDVHDKVVDDPSEMLVGLAENVPVGDVTPQELPHPPPPLFPPPQPVVNRLRARATTAITTRGIRLLSFIKPSLISFHFP
jgi:hypothetical protein